MAACAGDVLACRCNGFVFVRSDICVAGGCHFRLGARLDGTGILYSLVFVADSAFALHRVPVVGRKTGKRREIERIVFLTVQF